MEEENRGAEKVSGEDCQGLSTLQLGDVIVACVDRVRFDLASFQPECVPSVLGGLLLRGLACVITPRV